MQTRDLKISVFIKHIQRYLYSANTCTALFADADSCCWGPRATRDRTAGNRRRLILIHPYHQAGKSPLLKRRQPNIRDSTRPAAHLRLGAWVTAGASSQPGAQARAQHVQYSPHRGMRRYGAAWRRGAPRPSLRAAAGLGRRGAPRPAPPSSRGAAAAELSSAVQRGGAAGAVSCQ